MQGTILILEKTSTNRIMLKVQLSAGYYRVVQSECLNGADRIIACTNPDLILAGPNLPDGGVAAVCALRDAAAPGVPVMIVTRENDDAARQAALRCGAEDAMTPPLQDSLLLARIRRLIRDRNRAEDLRPRDSIHQVMGLEEAPVEFSRPAQVAVLARSITRAERLAARLGPASRHILRCLTPDGLRQTPAQRAQYDAILIDFTGRPAADNLRFLSDLRSRPATRNAAVVALTDPGNAAMEAEALDLGADDVGAFNCDAAELSLRLDRRLEARRHASQMRDTLQRGLRAAVRDPLTGLYNRRFAEPHLAGVARDARQAGRSFAVMLVDIDHFKDVNDRFGHPAGDQVIAETAQRLLSQIAQSDMLARIGGEEFLIVMADVTPDEARARAQLLRERVNCRPFVVDGVPAPIPVSVSIGAVAVPPDGKSPLRNPTRESGVSTTIQRTCRSLLAEADRALYAAKQTGRNRVSLIMAAA